MQSLNSSQTEYAEQKPVENSRPAFNFRGNLFRPKLKNDNIPQIVGAITPENTVGDKPKTISRSIFNVFWPDDNPEQNPTNKLVNNQGKKNENYESDLIRDKPQQVDILDEPDIFKFSDHQEETPEATRPKRFGDFFN